MTPLENLLATIKCQNPHRVPITILETEHAIKIAKTTYRTFINDPDVLARTLIKSAQRYGYDWIWIYISDWIEFEALGAKMEYSDVIPPRCLEFAVKDVDEVDELETPNPWEEGKMPVILRGIEILKEEVGDQLMLCGRVACPFSAVILMRGIKEGFIDLYQRYDIFKKMMDLGLEIAVSFAKAQLDVGVHALWVGDVFSSSRFISERIYLKSAFPYEKKLIDEIRRMGGLSFIFHDEINVNRLVCESKAGADVVGIGNDTDIKEARANLGDNVCLSGNVDPVKVMLQGTMVEVSQIVEKCIRDAGRKNFILNTGECVCRDTPPENIDSFIRTGFREGNLT